MARPPKDADKVDRQERIRQAVLDLLAEHGISGVSMRAVAKRAGVSLGPLSYHYEDKQSLVGAGLQRVEEQDVALVRPDDSSAPEERLRVALRRGLARVPDDRVPVAAAPAVGAGAGARGLRADQHETQQRYRQVLADLIRGARTGLPRAECRKRAADIDVLQNGLWLTALLGRPGQQMRV